MIAEPHRNWLEARGIPSDLAVKLGLSTMQRHGKNWLALPYLHDGQIVNRKYRFTSEKLHEMDKGGKLCFWNAEALKGARQLVITEGEFDAMAAIASGFAHTVSVPNGAPAEKADDPLNAKRYSYLWEAHEADLTTIETIILATDGDKPGRTLAHDLACILGKERCKFVEYPDGCKDLNEVLMKHGPRGVTQAVTGAKPFPVVGLYKLSDFPDGVDIQAMPTGIEALDEHMQIVFGTFTVFSGYSNMGKSTVMNTILAHCIDNHVPVCIASFETMPKPILRDGIARALLGCSYEDFIRHPQRQAAYDHIEDMVTVISNAMDDDEDITLEAYLELCRIAVVRSGAKVIVLDPWNELEHKRERDETETDYIGRAIRALKRFAKRYNVALWVVAHPTKPMKMKDGTVPAPGLYDIAGSANWANKADYGLIYHRPDKTVNAATLNVVKVRMGLPGKCGVINTIFSDTRSRIMGDPMMDD